ncbi:MAG TPA: Gfo/Idh/MocA family oxidoreductase [Phycisphaerae bacterium]|nr:Gfo/Idh/MocA family oxidoreductase [Phycisphaerae bacterium]HOQ87158.1 Gfo/Idh/MocA family oxidoreductase [Phycisphaerae bacterium]HPU27608.1 Gfo/Idh/MocA family oxidoreductase [Phycisphaerae bacterium]HPZ97924.1 Gfo/Idh/MocA family oxidoreductase [Phycisphaerae bacterium]HQE27872.1 Gfo/Idh/MocA family oxidoreductase [Phycisphaerae bacterium]
MKVKPSSGSRKLSRRQFVKGAAAAVGAGTLGFPTIVPSTVFGQSAPSNLIQVAQIGCGRIARESEFPGMFRHNKLARIVAVSDPDSIRVADAKQLIEARYAKDLNLQVTIKTYEHYREMLENKSIDAVCISTPDHWHALPTIEAALAGKDVYLQKPASLTIREGRQMAEVVKRTKRVFQQGSQQRSSPQFLRACELVRNGVIGKVKEVYIGLPVDPPGGRTEEMPVPSNLNYDLWLGSTPEVYYTEDRVHPQSEDIRKRYGRPGWLRCEQFGAGMITGWGAHHFDIAHWGMGTEDTGPIEIEGKAEYLTGGLWDVHGPYEIHARYANGAVVHVSNKLPNGVRFIGENGQWIFVSRGSQKATSSDPTAGQPILKPLDASDPKLLEVEFKDGDIRLHQSPKNDHHLDWLTSIRTREEPACPVEVGHRSCSACLLSQIAMRLGRRLTYDPVRERFTDEDANRMLSRPQRAPYSVDAVLAKHNIKI